MELRDFLTIIRTNEIRSSLRQALKALANGECIISPIDRYSEMRLDSDNKQWLVVSRFNLTEYYPLTTSCVRAFISGEDFWEFSGDTNFGLVTLAD